MKTNDSYRTRYGFAFKKRKSSIALLLRLVLGTAGILFTHTIAYAVFESKLPSNSIPSGPLSSPIFEPAPLPNPGIEPVPQPLQLRSVERTWIEIVAKAPKQGSSKLYWQQGSGNFFLLRIVSAGAREEIRNEGLHPNTRYCYRLDTTYNGQITSDYLCATTKWRVEFSNLVITPAESERVLKEFNWSETDKLLEGAADEPALYYMNILLDDVMGVRALEALGVHVQASPIFPQELAGWNDSSALVNEDGHVTGRWYYAVVPGALFNEIRAQSLRKLAERKLPAFRAIVFRTIPTSLAKAYPTDAHRLSYAYLGEQGFEYNATPRCQHVEGVGEVCTVQVPILGWLARKAFDFVAGNFDRVVEGIQGAIGKVKRIVKGEVTLELQFRLINTDPTFGASLNTLMYSGWKGKELYLKDVRVHVRQGLAAFYGRTDNRGFVRLSVAKNASAEVCVEAENDFVKLTEFVNEKLVCLGNIGSLSGGRFETLEVKHPYFNVLAQMTDAAEYLETVADYRMGKITVLVGSWADRLAVLGRAFTPCMGRMPNLAIGGAGDLLGLLIPGVAIGSAVAEFLYSVDIVLPRNVEWSRGVGVHEYGHAVMCSMLAKQGKDKFQIAWTDVIIATANQSPNNEASYINEAFADFISSQVVGGTDYFQPKNSVADASLKMNYCLASAGSCLDIGTWSSETFSQQVQRIASLLHDVFDGHAASPDRPNDGSHWDRTGGSTILALASSKIDLGDDEAITLKGSFLSKLFEYWSKRGDTLREASFLGGLEDLLRDQSYLASEICKLFSLHSPSTTCAPGGTVLAPTTPVAPGRPNTLPVAGAH